MTGSAPNGEPLQAPWAYYRRTGLSEMRPYVLGESLEGISVSEPDKNHIAYCLDSGKNPAGYIARNPKNHADQWYVAQAYFEENLEPVRERDPAAELAAAVSRYLGAHDDLRAWDEDDEGSYDHYKAQVRGDTTLDALRAALAAYEASRK